jgi:hypothetical protein
MPDQWPRAYFRAALREVGYDAIGTRTLLGALAYPAETRTRGPVRALVIDESALRAGKVGAMHTDPLAPLRQKHGLVPIVLLASAVRSDPPGEWARVLRRPFSVEDAVDAVQTVAPLPLDRRMPVDVKADARDVMPHP